MCLAAHGAFADDAAEESSATLTYTLKSFEGAEFHVVRVDLQRAIISSVWRDAAGQPLLTFENALRHLRETKVKPLFITNAGIFTPSVTPGGLYVESGEVMVPINRNNGAGNFHLKPNGVFYIDAVGAHVEDTGRVTEDMVKSMQVATQSGPMLVLDGEIHSQFQVKSENKKIRSGVGVVTPNQVYFVLSKGEVNFHHFARFFRDELKCSDALYLDGVISRFYLPNQSGFQPGVEQFAAMVVVTAR
jgi:uncharacterized protein YigE (DUF2233 family)